MMQSVSMSSIPCYLQNGDLFTSFCWEAGSEEAVLDVPIDVLKDSCSVASTDDLKSLLTSLRFWLVKEAPNELIDYVLRKDTQECNDVLAEFRADLPYISALESVRASAPINPIAVALKFGVLEIVQYLIENGHHSGGGCDVAAQAGHLHCLQYLHQHGWSKLELSTANAAAEGGSLECMKYLHEHHCPWDRSTTAQAAKFGHVHILQFLHEHGCAWSWEVVWLCVLHENIDCLRYALAQRCPKEGDTICAKAAQFNRLECLQILHEAGVAWQANVTQQAAKHGHLDCLKYAHENGCPWDDEVCFAAPQHGRLNCLQYAHENGCPWTDKVLSLAKLYGYTDCWRYAVEHGAPSAPP